MDELLERAFAAYFRYPWGDIVDQPSASASTVDEHGGRQYVVLRNAKGVVAVYRVRTAGMLKRLRRWPAPLG